MPPEVGQLHLDEHEEPGDKVVPVEAERSVGRDQPCHHPRGDRETLEEEREPGSRGREHQRTGEDANGRRPEEPAAWHRREAGAPIEGSERDERDEPGKEQTPPVGLERDMIGLLQGLLGDEALRERPSELSCQLEADLSAGQGSAPSEQGSEHGTEHHAVQDRREFCGEGKDGDEGHGQGRQDVRPYADGLEPCTEIVDECFHCLPLVLPHPPSSLPILRNAGEKDTGREW